MKCSVNTNCNLNSRALELAITLLLTILLSRLVEDTGLTLLQTNLRYR